MIDTRLQRAYLIRLVEERLLALFSEGKVAGTTHTCIGQELSAVLLAESLDPERDIIFSNHRCHGHFIAWTDDVEGLIAEIMGTSAGVCTGIGGSQHLCGRRFFSNGVQGGIVPVAAGLAFAQKRVGRRSVVAVCIGDGTLGEGVIYETFNMAAKWGLPLLILLENNLYAQSTHQRETLAGDICARAAAFGITTYAGSTWDYRTLGETLHEAVRLVRERCVPAFVRVDTYRLAAHSKGDDNRDATEIAEFAARDPVNEMLASLGTRRDVPEFVGARERVDRAVAQAAAGRPRDVLPATVGIRPGTVLRRVTQIEEGTQLEGINRALRAWLRADDRVVLIGEDIRSPYGGAFKITRGLSDEFPDRVINAPISEAGIVGIGNGLALGGARPIIEIMFGDFLTLCCDQLVNHAAKFKSMYAEKVRAPVIVRTPMGGGRGYGPTHSQNLEKHFVGVPGLVVVVMHGRVQVGAMYEALRDVEDPVLIIENKLLYKERAAAPLPPGYALSETDASLPGTVLSPAGEPDLTVVAFGRMSGLAERAAASLVEREEIAPELIFPLLASPLDIQVIRDSVARTGRLLVVEEGAAGFDLASEVIAGVATTYSGQKPLHVRRLAAHPAPIPSSIELERLVLPSEAGIYDICLELFDA
ncbi:MAG TPA: thiamine pyrophosphate-dependent enzyme [Steroidobacteraceae bacterium]|nr:thiamine pyrophosphate-dependent enzyme [Steroidobacteraceae bacterium]